MATRWAICATGNMCNDFCTALLTLPDTEHKVVAVASRFEEKAAKFAEKFGIPKSFGSYEALASLEEVGEDIAGFVTLSYSGNRFANITFSNETQLVDDFLIIRGTKGNIKIPDTFWCPTSVVLPDGQVKEWPLPETPKGHEYAYIHNQWLIYEAQAVREALTKGLKECPKFTLADSEKLMVIIDKVMQQNGINYTL